MLRYRSLFTKVLIKQRNDTFDKYSKILQTLISCCTFLTVVIFLGENL